MQIDEDRLFETYFRRFGAPVHSFALRRADAETAQDVTAETFLVAWRRRAEMPAEPLPWLYGIARGVLANDRRAGDRRSRLAARVAAQPAPVGSSADHEILRALAVLRENDREALLLSAWEGLSASQAGKVLGCTPAAFAVRLHRARRRLESVLAETAGRGDEAQPERPIPEVPA